jgi:hypothetical protein
VDGMDLAWLGRGFGVGVGSGGEDEDGEMVGKMRKVRTQGRRLCLTCERLIEAINHHTVVRVPSRMLRTSLVG